MFYILVLTIGIPGHHAAMTSVPGFSELAACESAGEAWRLEAKRAEYSPRYYCVPGPEKRAMTLGPR